MSNCCVNVCENNFRKNPNVKYYVFPIYRRTDTLERKRLILRQRMEWIRVLQNKSTMSIDNIHTKRVCSAHFKRGKKAAVENIDDPDWIPWINLDEKHSYLSKEEILNDVNYESDDFFPNNEPTNKDELEFDATVIDTETADIQGYRFGVSKQTASKAFFTCLNVMYFKMKGMVYRPPKEEVVNTMPDCFKNNFGDEVTHIIDCLELFIERPYYFDTRIQCWSEYKHHYTLKYLVSITPQGMFEFVSKGFGGRANDMLVTTTCNFLDILEPNDLVLADKGFNMQDVFKMRRVDLEIPAFVFTQKQLHPLDVEYTRKIANVRIHVERCIGFLRRKFLILHRIIPVTMLSKPISDSDNVPIMDKIMTVCCALCNLCPTIIPNTSE